MAYTNNNGLALTQDLIAVLVANTLYTLTVDIRSRTDGSTHQSSTLQLRTAADDILATVTQGALGGGLNATLTATFLASAIDPNLGENLKIALIGGGAQSDWDNVHLDAVLQTNNRIPEPATLALLGLGLAGLALRRRRAARE